MRLPAARKMAARWRRQYFWNYLFTVLPQDQTRAINAAPLLRVTICRELRHTDQLIKLDHGGTDRRQNERLGGVFVYAFGSRARSPTRRSDCLCLLDGAQKVRHADNK